MDPIEFLRQFRFGGYAIFDFAIAFLGIYLFSPLLSKIFLKMRVNIPKRNWIFLTLPIGIATHLLIGTITPMTARFLDPSGHYTLKVIILVLLILGFRGIRLCPKR